jgi:molecular chaperone DnaK
MKERVEAFQAVLYQIGAAVYEKAGQAPPAESAPTPEQPSVSLEGPETIELDAAPEAAAISERSLDLEETDITEAETLLTEPNFMAMAELDASDELDTEVEKDSEIDPGNPFIINSNS